LSSNASSWDELKGKDKIFLFEVPLESVHEVGITLSKKEDAQASLF
jgi:hypothetical protein